MDECLAEGKSLFSVCSLAGTFQECCKLAVEARFDEQCLFDESVAQFDWARKCCTKLDGVSCHGFDCFWYQPSLCCPGSNGLIFPVSEAEALWPQPVKIIVYIICLGWLFMAVTAAADMFMQGVEVITSTQKQVIVIVNGEKKKISVQQWNDTVANLTLMALGSSAPEILLSIIELIVNRFYAGVLGPATIVGSASFNLFVIPAICIVSIPEGEVRFIKDVDVYIVTASFSIFAYLWVVFILEVTTPDRVEIWEGLTTFAFSAVLILVAYLADIGKIRFRPSPRAESKYIAPEVRAADGEESPEERRRTVQEQADKMQQALATQSLSKKVSPAQLAFYKRATGADDADLSLLDDPVTKSAFAPMVREYRETYGNITDREVAQLLACWMNEGPAPKMSRAAYRVAATHMLVGGGRISETGFGHRHSVHGQEYTNTYTGLRRRLSGETGQEPIETSRKKDDEDVCVVSFDSPFYSCVEGDKIVHLNISRTGPECELEVPYKTVAASATENEDFIPVDSSCTLKKGEMTKSISIVIVDDDMPEEEEHFFVRLGAPKSKDGTLCALGYYAEARITIIDDDKPGILVFDSQEVCVKNRVNTAKVRIKRQCGSSVGVAVDYHTFPQTATPDRDYVTTKGELTFAVNEIDKCILIPLVDVLDRRKTVTFRVVLSNPQGGVTLCGDSGEPVSDQIQTVVALQPFDSSAEVEHGDTTDDAAIGKIPEEEKTLSWKSAYAEQFREAIYANGSKEESKNASIIERIVHYISFPFKIVLAVTPPADFCGGWLRFFVALIFIAILTALINEMAQLVGCSLGVPDAITAVTFVALGTSIPDTFASRMAAQSDTHADACIGNITGSNSVNVFLGLGISWSIGAFYWAFSSNDDVLREQWLSRYEGRIDPDVKFGGFAVRAGTLSLNVIAFCVGAAFAFLILWGRRVKFGGELGGPKKYQYLSSALMVFLWVAYIISASITAIVDSENQKKLR